MNTVLPELFLPSAYFDPEPGSAQYERDRYTPILSLRETPAAFEIEMDLPCADREDVDVHAHRHDLVIRCRHAVDHAGPAEGAAFGAFVRRVRLAEAIDPDRVEATLRDGVLRIVAPKRAS